MPRPGSIAHSRPRTLLALAALFLTLAAIVGGNHASAASSGVQIKVAKTKLGQILVNAQGEPRV